MNIYIQIQVTCTHCYLYVYDTPSNCSRSVLWAPPLGPSQTTAAAARAAAARSSRRAAAFSHLFQLGAKTEKSHQAHQHHQPQQQHRQQQQDPPQRKWQECRVGFCGHSDMNTTITVTSSSSTSSCSKILQLRLVFVCHSPSLPDVPCQHNFAVAYPRHWRMLSS